MPEVNDTSQDTAAPGPSADAQSTVPAPRKPRWVLRGVLAIIAIVVFVLIPGYLATQPKFLARYPGMGVEYVTWSTSAHSRATCQSCHVPPGFIPQAGYRVRMLGEFYVSLVNPSHQAKVFAPPTNAACQSCHLDLRTVSPSGDLNIPHRAHVIVLKLPCVRCHRYLVHAKSPEGSHKPTMATCLVCHDGHQAKNSCSTCHTNKDIPANHRQPDWVVIHPTMVKKIDCQRCHKWTANWCSACHERRPASHTANWRVIHGAKVKAHRNCEVCHTGAFCTRCHGTVPQLNFDPALKLVK